MSGLIKSFIVLAVLSLGSFWVARKISPDFISSREFKRWRVAWLAVLAIGFFGQNIWIVFGGVAAVCWFYVPGNPRNRIIFYLLLLSTLPMLRTIIWGFGGVNYLISLSYQRLLVFTLLTGMLLFRSDRIRLLTLPSDAMVLLFVIYIGYSSFRDNTFTNALREFFLNVVDIFIPYFAISRYVDSKEQLNRALFAMMVGVAPFALIGCFEMIRHWHLYDSMSKQLTGSPVSLFDVREGGLRGSAVYFSPIVLGYVMVIAAAFLFYFQPMIRNQTFVRLAGGGIVACILATMARGTWIGLAFMYAMYVLTGRGGMKKLMLWGVAGIAALPLLSLTTLGKKFIALLPFIGESRADTVDYRQRLIEQALIVFRRNPLAGSTTYLNTPEMESMRQGQGIIDVVNSYIGLVLPYGLIGLAIFLYVFLKLTWNCYTIIKKLSGKDEELQRMGRMFFALLTSILLMIATVSSIDYIPVYYWTVAGLAATYLRICKLELMKIKT